MSPVLVSRPPEMLQFVSNQVGDFPELFDDTNGTLQTTTTPATQRSLCQPVATPQTPTQAMYQTTSVGLAPSQSLNPQSLPLTPPLTPVQTASVVSLAGQQQQQQLVTRTPPLLQPRPHTLQSIQPQPQQTAQPTIQVLLALLASHHPGITRLVSSPPSRYY